MGVKNGHEIAPQASFVQQTLCFNATAHANSHQGNSCHDKLIWGISKGNLDVFKYRYSPGASVLSWLWIVNVKGPKSQVDFLKILYVVVIPIGAQKSPPAHIKGPSKGEILTQFHVPRNAQIIPPIPKHAYVLSMSNDCMCVRHVPPTVRRFACALL